MESFARNRGLQIRWHDEGMRMEDYVRPYLQRMERENRFGGYFIFQAMERGWTFRSSPVLVRRRPEGPADYPILRRYRSRYRYYYFQDVLNWLMKLVCCCRSKVFDSLCIPGASRRHARESSRPVYSVSKWLLRPQPLPA